MTKLTNPMPLFLNARGNLLDAGFIYVGVANGDPEAAPINLFWDAAMTIPAAQPLRTLGGYVVNEATPSFVFMAEEDYSLRVRDADGGVISYVPSIVASGSQFQPLDVDLTAIAALATTPYGRSLLTLVNAAGLRQVAGISDSLPLVGGTVSGNILRQSAGPHLYHVNPAYTSGRLYGPENVTDPTTQPGDIWFKADA